MSLLTIAVILTYVNLAINEVASVELKEKIMLFDIWSLLDYIFALVNFAS